MIDLTDFLNPPTFERMHLIYSALVTGLLLLGSAGAQADVYSEVSQSLDAKQWDKAQAHAERHLKAQPTDPQMRLLLSRIQDGLGQTEQAMQTLQDLSLSFPELPEPHNNLAALLARQNRYAEAVLALQKAIRVRPDYATALENLGDVYLALAIEAFQSAGQAAPPQPRAVSKALAAEKLLQSAAQ